MYIIDVYYQQQPIQPIDKMIHNTFACRIENMALACGSSVSIKDLPKLKNEMIALKGYGDNCQVVAFYIEQVDNDLAWFNLYGEFWDELYTDTCIDLARDTPQVKLLLDIFEGFLIPIESIIESRLATKPPVNIQPELLKPFYVNAPDKVLQLKCGSVGNLTFATKIKRFWDKHDTLS